MASIGSSAPACKTHQAYIKIVEYLGDSDSVRLDLREEEARSYILLDGIMTNLKA
jgi:hypothetical protein